MEVQKSKRALIVGTSFILGMSLNSKNFKDSLGSNFANGRFLNFIEVLLKIKTCRQKLVKDKYKIYIE